MRSLNTQSEVERLLELKRNREIYRLGKLFETDANYYYYDTGTGKILRLDEQSHKIMKALFDSPSISSVDELIVNDQDITPSALNRFCSTVISENLFRAYKPNQLYTVGHNEILEKQVNTELRQVILELTGRCNLRCGYCIYNEDCNLNRNFNDGDMSLEVAKATIDYAAKHANKKIAVTFYGGEPLLRFDLLKWVVEYSLRTLKEKEITFSLTTNLTLVTKEIAEYLASVPGLGVVCSMDGPENIHNSYRKFSNGEGSYSRAIKGLSYLCDTFSKSQNALSINAVFAPPYSHGKLSEINHFFSNLEILPPNIDINIGYVAEGSLPETRVIPKNMEEADPQVMDPLWTWLEQRAQSRNFIRNETPDISSSGIETALISIERRYLSDKPSEFYPFNGCCVPGARRLYVNTNGNLYVCERVGLSPSIGNIFEGINFDRLKKYYVDDYSQGSIGECQNCWAIRLCSMCYAHNYTEDGFNTLDKNRKCNSRRNMHLKDLVLYHTIREQSPEKLDFLKHIELY